VFLKCVKSVRELK